MAIVILPQTPTGVEHPAASSSSCESNRVILPQTPTGVEHQVEAGDFQDEDSVILPQTPTGVEHRQPVQLMIRKNW